MSLAEFSLAGLSVGLFLLSGVLVPAVWVLIRLRECVPEVQKEDLPRNVGPALEPATWARLLNWAATSHPGLLAEMVNIYLRETPKKIANLQEAARAADNGQWQKTAHALRLASDAVGAHDLVALADGLENLQACPPLDHSRVWVEVLKKEFDRVKKELEQQLAKVSVSEARLPRNREKPIPILDEPGAK